MESKITAEIFTIEMREDGILHVHVQGDHTVDMRLYNVLITSIGEMTGGKKVPILSTTEDLTLPDDEVRAYMANPGANPYCLANAMIAPSIAQKLVINIYVRIMKPARPIRLFRNEKDAIAWLKTFL